MDVRYVYGSPGGSLIAYIYAPPEFDVPELLELPENATGELVTFIRISDRTLRCGAVAGVPKECDSPECHTRELGACACGRHDRVSVQPNSQAALAAATQSRGARR